MSDDEVPSPCTRICVVDDERQLCRGCYRTLDEISRWASYTRAQKLALLTVLARRREHAPFPHHVQSQ
jgi:predicted Fe-S protein YdhL (DUF1289 family)